MNKLTIEQKLMLERVYEWYGNESLTGGNDHHTDTLRNFIKFRLNVSGGEKNDMGHIGMNYVESLINEICLLNDLISDYVGEYRGESIDNYKDLFYESCNKFITDDKLNIDCKIAFYERHINYFE